MNGSLATILVLVSLPAASFAASYATCRLVTAPGTPTAYSQHGSVTPKCEEEREMALDGWNCTDWKPLDLGNYHPLRIYLTVAQSTGSRSN